MIAIGRFFALLIADAICAVVGVAIMLSFAGVVTGLIYGGMWVVWKLTGAPW